MKIALISFHNAYNYGACLQAYALQKSIETIGITCEYIDYVNLRRANSYKMSARIAEAVKNKNIKEIAKNICGTPLVWLRGSKFKRFYRKNLKKTSKTYHTCEEAKELNNLYDKFIIGSDQVWNYNHNGQDPAYFLNFVFDNTKKISYSSSFGLTEVPDRLKSWYSELINGINCLSVREKKGIELIQTLTGQKAHLVLDPVFLLTSSEWKNLIRMKNIKEKYTFYYINARFNVDDFVRVTGWNDGRRYILSSSIEPRDFIKSKQKIVFSIAPETFLQQIYGADLVVTTSFHCLAFAIILHKPFFVVLSGNSGRDERLINLLQITGLENRIFSYNMTLDNVKESINYNIVEERLKPYKEYSKRFLYTAIYSGKEKAELICEPALDKNNIQTQRICSHDICTGCGACFAKCPVQAIKMKPDPNGFLHPVIDDRQCIHCNACKMVCQTNQNHESIVKQYFYAFRNTDDIRKVSSSGGAFIALAQKNISEHGIVIASEMNGDWHNEHTLTDSMEGVKKQAHTYYVQGKAYDCFPKTQDLLKQGKKVLFTGTPCQIAGLKKYLCKDYDNLITCDIICHGIPSPKMFQIYIDYLKRRGNLTSLKHRDKEIGWKGYNVSAVIDGKTYRNVGWLRAYLVMFSHGLINRDSCYQCPYSSYNRPGDITIGDYWGIEKFHPELKDRLGVSLIITNNDKGDKYFLKAAKGKDIVKLSAEESTQNSLTHPMQKPMNRLACIKTMEQSYEVASRIYGEWNFKGSLKQFVHQFLLQLSCKNDK